MTKKKLDMGGVNSDFSNASKEDLRVDNEGRITKASFHINEKKFQILKAHLTLEGETLKGFFNDCIDKYLSVKDKSLQ